MMTAPAYCRYCGSALFEPTATCMQCGKAQPNVSSLSAAQITASTLYSPTAVPARCTGCDRMISPPGAAFCSFCRQPVASTEHARLPVITPFWRRFAAVTLDRAIILALLLLLVWIGEGMTGPHYDASVGHIVSRVTFLGGFIMLLGFLSAPEYFIVCETLLGTRSIGYRLLGIRLVRLNGRRLNLGIHTVRWCGQFLSIGLLGLGYFTMLRRKNRQTWHDMMAGTIVVRS